MKRVLVAGTFDPVTIGHMDIIQRACALFDEVHIVIFVNPDKMPMFCITERQKFLHAACADMSNVIINHSTGMLVDYMKINQLVATVRGARNTKDFEYELEMAALNRQLWNGCETVILPCDKQYAEISSTKIRQALQNGQDVSNFLPKAILPLVNDTLQR